MSKTIKFFTVQPFITLILILLFWARAYLELGYKPAYGNPDPKTLNMELHLYSIYLSFLLTPISMIVVILARRILGKREKIIFVFSFLLLTFLYFTNYQDIINWILD